MGSDLKIWRDVSSALSSRSRAARQEMVNIYEMFELIWCSFDSYVLFMGDIFDRSDIKKNFIT